MKPVAAILGVLAAFLAARYALRQGFESVVKSVTTDKAATCLEMLGNTTREEDRFTYIVGSIRNNCDQKMGDVTISFKLDRSSGSSLGLPQVVTSPYASRSQPQIQRSKPIDLPEALIFAYLRDVKPRETRQFKSQMHIPSNSTYRFGGIRAF